MQSEEKDYLYKIIGENVRYHRMKAQFSQEELGKKVDKSRTSIVNIEKGMQHPPIHLLIDISRKLSVSFEKLIDLEKLKEYTNSKQERMLNDVLKKIDVNDKEVIANFIKSHLKDKK